MKILSQMLASFLDGKYHKQIKIEENIKGFSYKKLFQDYLNETVTEVWVEDPYIRQVHQVKTIVDYRSAKFCSFLTGKINHIELPTVVQLLEIL